jgi:uncharacterized membrane protein YtjA (UPF0391 family)
MSGRARQSMTGSGSTAFSVKDSRSIARTLLQGSCPPRLVAESLRRRGRAAPQFLHAAGGFTKHALRHGVCRFGMLFALTPAASPHNPRSQAMLSWALAFFIIAIIAAVFGFTGIAAGAAEIAKILFVVFVVLFLVSLVAGLLRRP